MPRKKKDAVRLSIKLDRNLSELLAQYCTKYGQNKTEVIENALNKEFQEENEKNKKNSTK